MEKDLLQHASDYTKKRKRRKRWQQVVSVLAAIVVFITTYLFIDFACYYPRITSYLRLGRA